ncbi:oxidoreductase [Amycolatopsis sp. WAC 04182]|uniref:SDR family NAD(P)-dependent oxidoreductase n=1 Tax=Amycolatopsis sp. WAC 04182 TaxID=2203198 RepID=UPI000F78CB5C|nr:SDR family NAD(P)-dependent oxidoreductase [Amycolatopsis sp. WAC 04182]RSN59233.1 oxidoreductase [Amycolatopsis sp. WAC 04182]
MKTIVISGGTDGMGRALARHYQDRGDTVVVLGRDPDKGADFPGFIRTDLSSVANTRKVVADITEAFPVVDALVLCARHFRSARRQTAEGFESTFALEYLSRFLLGHGLACSLNRAGKPVIVNVSGPGVPKPEIHWDDTGLERGYDGVTAQMQAGRANDLLGVDFAARFDSISYVLVNPGAVATSFSGEYDAATLAHVERLKKFGKPVAEGIAPIIALVDEPPGVPLSAFVEGRRIVPDLDRVAAARLADLTHDLLRSHA